jgi:glycosyltransferase involved in cell wall biosynthesis
MKITAAMIVFNGDHVIEQSIQSVYDFVDEIVIAEGPVKYWQEMGFERSSDNTIELLRNFHDPDKKLKIVNDKYSEKDDQFQRALDLMTVKPDYLIQVDSDEVWTEKSLIGLRTLLDERKPVSVGVHSHTFVGGLERTIGGFEEKTDNFLRVFRWSEGCHFLTHRPPTIQYPDGNQTRGHGHIDSDEARDSYGVSMCHYSYVWPSQVKSKIGYYRAKVSGNNCIPGFYENYWLPWTKTSSLEEKWEIEKQILGMHEFRPEVRGPAFTKPYVGDHPTSIISVKDKLVKRIQEEVSE